MLNRIEAVWRTRGPAGFVRFVGTRIYSRRQDVIFEAYTRDYANENAWAGPGSLICVTSENVASVLTPPLTAQLSQGEGGAYVDSVRRGDLALLVVDEAGVIVHHSYVLFRTRTKALLNEAESVPLFANCVTRPQARGQRLYPRVLRCGLALLGAMGHARAVINCAPSNAASIRGIEHAGFRLARTTDTWLVLSRLALQVTRDPRDMKRVRAYLG